jgi:uncharacterized protein Veg
MRKQTLTIESVKNKIDEMVGKSISMQVCRGRKQIRYYKGIVEHTYPSVFTVRLTEGDSHFTALSYSYSDVVCGEVILDAT